MWDEATLEEAVIRAVDPRQLIQRVADQAAGLIAAADGAMVALVDGDTLTYVCGSGRFARFVGTRIPLAGSLSGLAIARDEVLRTDDATTDDRVDHGSTAMMSVLSAIGVPLRTRGAPIGVLNVSSGRRAAFTDADVAVLSRLAEFVSVVIGEALESARVTRGLLAGAAASSPPRTPDIADRAERFVANVLSPNMAVAVATRQQVEQVLAMRAFSVVFQPVFDLGSGQLSSVEALTRFHAHPYRPPDECFREAHDVGLGVELEVTAIETALASLSRIPAGAALAVNAGPETITSTALRDLLHSAVDPRRIVVELTEHVQVDDYEGLGLTLMQLRRSGIRLAIDDTGAGFASLAHILRLAPDFIKLDRALVTGIDVDPVRRALAAALVAFAADTGAVIIAEGIENAAEFQALHDLGIRRGQGFHLGRPGPLEAIPDALAPSGAVRSGPAVRRPVG